jgi:5-methylcytosine-specific restriction endonuclease McrA
MKKVCKWCAKSFEAPGTKSTCSAACRRNFKNKLKALWYRRTEPEHIINCRVCGKPFIRVRGKKVYCSEECKTEGKATYMRKYAERDSYKAYISRRNHTEAYRQAIKKYHDSFKGQKIRWERRAHKLKVVVGKIDVDWINCRDGCRCGICGKPVDLELRHPDPLSRSYDHIVPLTLGGEHSNRNLQLAHLTCNLRKNKFMGKGVQMYLF